MSEDLTKIRLELDINAQKMLQQVQVHNREVKEKVKRGIEKALKDVFEDDNFENKIAEVVKGELQNSVKRAASDWTMRNKIHEAINKNIEGKIDEVASKWANNIAENIEKDK